MYPACLPQDITSIQKLLIPVNLGYHWILLVGYNSLILIFCIFKKCICKCVQVYDIERKTIYSYDSYMGDRTSSRSPYTNVMAMIGCVYV